MYGMTSEIKNRVPSITKFREKKKKKRGDWRRQVKILFIFMNGERSWQIWSRCKQGRLEEWTPHLVKRHNKMREKSYTYAPRRASSGYRCKWKSLHRNRHNMLVANSPGLAWHIRRNTGASKRTQSKSEYPRCYCYYAMPSLQSQFPLTQDVLDLSILSCLVMNTFSNRRRANGEEEEEEKCPCRLTGSYVSKRQARQTPLASLMFLKIAPPSSSSAQFPCSDVGTTSLMPRLSYSGTHSLCPRWRWGVAVRRQWGKERWSTRWQVALSWKKGKSNARRFK